MKKTDSKTFDFYFDVVSPASYLAWTQLPKLLEETGASVVYHPVFLPGIFDKAGSASPITVPAKNKWIFEDFTRFAKRYNVPFVMNSKFPQSSVYAMRGLNNFRDHPHFRVLVDGFFNAMWVDNQDINDPAIVETIVKSANIRRADYLEAMQDPANKQLLIDVTNKAVERGVFGVPTFFVGTEMHFGQDRLDFVREALLQ